MPRFNDVLFEPPAPVAYVTLRDEAGVEVLDIPLLIDTGADVTLLPASAVEKLGAVRTASDVGLAGFDGHRSAGVTVSLTLIFDRLSFRGDFFILDGEVGVLGRNILNNVTLVINGPKQTWDRIRS